MLPPPPQDDQQSAPSTSDQTLRTPASTPTARLPPAARQEYDQYVQGRLKQMHPQGTLAAVRTTLLQGVCIHKRNHWFFSVIRGSSLWYFRMTTIPSVRVINKGRS